MEITINKPIPSGAHLVPSSAKKVFSGVIFDVYQWQQKMFDGSYETFEMLKRPDTVSAILIKDGKLVALSQLQPSWNKAKYGFPGGRVDNTDGSPLEAIQREVKEETGMTFNSWKLIEVVQVHEKIEWFHYQYIASDCVAVNIPNVDSGEKIRVVEMTFEAALKLSKTEPRMGSGLLDKYKTIEDLLTIPEY